MVERTEAQGFDEFSGEVIEVVLEPAKSEDYQDQYHITIKPLDVQVTGKTGMMHEWIRVPGKATEATVPQGSVIDGYIKALERLDKSVKAVKTVESVFKWMEGKKFHFAKEKLGKAYGNYPAADYWVPVSIEK